MKAKTKKLITKKKVAKKALTKTKQPIIKNKNFLLNSENTKKKVFPYIIEDIIRKCQMAKVGQSIRLGKLGRLKKARRQGIFNGKAYKVYTYSFKAFSTLKNSFWK